MRFMQKSSVKNQMAGFAGFKKEGFMQRRLRKKSVRFNPSRAYIDEAISVYLSNGGQITRIEFDEKSYQDFVSSPEMPALVDDFLNGLWL